MSVLVFKVLLSMKIMKEPFFVRFSDEHLLLHNQAGFAEPGAAGVVLSGLRRTFELPFDRGADASKNS